MQTAPNLVSQVVAIGTLTKSRCGKATSHKNIGPFNLDTRVMDKSPSFEAKRKVELEAAAALGVGLKRDNLFREHSYL